MTSRYVDILFRLSLLSLIGIAGCPPDSIKQIPSNSRPFQDEEVTLLAPKSLNIVANWEDLVQEWSSQSGALHRFVEFETVEQLSTQLQREEATGGSFVLFPLSQLCEIDTKWSPLPVTNGEFDSRDIFKGLRERVLTRDRQLIANPVSVPVLLCYYRSDLLRAAKRKAPATWEEYHELVVSLDQWAPGLIAVEPLGPEFRATTFFARSLAYCKHPENYSVWFDVDSGKPVLNTPGMLKALAIAHRTWSKLPAEVTNYGPDDCRRLLLTGKAAIGLTFEIRSANLNLSSQSEPVKERQRGDGVELGICRLPGSKTVFNRNSKRWDSIPASQIHAPALCGFSGFAAGVVHRGKQGKDAAAANLLISLSSPSLFDQAFAKLPKSPCRESQMSHAQTWFGPELSTDEAGQYCDAVAQSLRDTQLVFELPVAGADEFRRAASAELEALLRKDADSEQVSTALQKSFEAIVERRGWESVRDSHRRGLGLSPALKK